MSIVEVTYQGEGQCAALNAINSKQVSVDCSMTRAQEFGPETLVAAGLGSCMLISMGHFADRHELDISGARADVEVNLGGKPDWHITDVDVTVHVPGAFSAQEQTGLEKAADACPIKHSFRADTKIRSRFVFGEDAGTAA